MDKFINWCGEWWFALVGAFLAELGIALLTVLIEDRVMARFFMLVGLLSYPGIFGFFKNAVIAYRTPS